jgi:hypothetical protein
MNDHGGNTGLDAVVERYVTPNRRYLKLLHGTVVRMDEEERWALAMLLALLNHFRLFALFRSVSRLGWTRFGSPGMPCIEFKYCKRPCITTRKAALDLNTSGNRST